MANKSILFNVDGNDFADAIIENPSFQEKVTSIFRKVINEKPVFIQGQSALEYVSDLKARCMVSGDAERPVSKKTFNKLRAEGKITTYYPSEGRTACKVSELYGYIESTKQTSKEK